MGRWGGRGVRWGGREVTGEMWDWRGATAEEQWEKHPSDYRPPYDFHSVALCSE